MTTNQGLEDLVTGILIYKSKEPAREVAKYLIASLKEEGNLIIPHIDDLDDALEIVQKHVDPHCISRKGCDEAFLSAMTEYAYIKQTEIHNKAVQECIDTLKELGDGPLYYVNPVLLEKLEKLKR